MYVTTDVLLDGLQLIINKNDNSTKYLLNKILDIYKTQQTTTELLDKPLADFYTRICRMAIQRSVDKSDIDSLRSIILKFITDPVCVDYPNIAHQLEEYLLSPVMSPTNIVELKRSLGVTINTVLLDKAFRIALAKTSSIQNLSTVEQQLNEIKSLINTTNAALKESSEFITTEADRYNTVDFNQISSLKEQFNIYSDRTHENNIIKTGLQALNISLGPNLGMVPGQSIVFVAGAHQYKSSMLLSCALWALRYNDLKPFAIDKTALVQYFTLENEPNQNVKWIFDKLYKEENNYQSPPPNFTPDDMAIWLHTHLSTYSTHFRMERYPAGTFTTEDFKNRILALEADGYEIKLVVLDYLEEMHKSNNGDARDQQIKRLITELCDFCKEKGITLVTAHALNRTYRDVADPINLVKKINERHIAEGPAIKKIPDVVFYMYLEYNSDTNVRYLTVKLDKLRYFGDNLPESKKYFAYPFIPGRGIVDDINGKAGYVSDIYGDTRYDFSNVEKMANYITENVEVFEKPDKTDDLAANDNSAAPIKIKPKPKLAF